MFQVELPMEYHQPHAHVLMLLIQLGLHVCCGQINAHINCLTHAGVPASAPLSCSPHACCSLHAADAPGGAPRAVVLLPVGPARPCRHTRSGNEVQGHETGSKAGFCTYGGGLFSQCIFSLTCSLTLFHPHVCSLTLLFVTPAQVQQQLASLVGASGSGLAGLGGFAGFAGGNSASSIRPAASAAPQVAHLASSAADRLLLAAQGIHAPHGIAASMGLSGNERAAMAGSSNIGSSTDTNKEARLTLLRAWMNAAAAAADGRTRSTDGALQQLQQQQEDQLLRDAATAGASVGGLGPLSVGGLRTVAQDLVSVMGPADVANLLQQLLILQRDNLQQPSAMYL